ncbi:MAG: T9SS type A sorting domain-containing protein [Flavobacteriales bacterium]|nr:T9SS type A sorting domain-containing protein [Flavobacteriales bacterium]MBK6752874.1 T9SS type A sorting domain-containing protein [Flavobacteriales bacterium]MBK7754508.1 T9SS type A sorting domain-containing protein [Flavobacteriales bacterium]
MKQLNFQTIAKAVLMTLVLGSPALMSAQIFPIGTITSNSTPHAYPNPFTTQLSVEVPNPGTALCRIYLVRSNGVIAQSETVPYAQIMTINTSTLNDGTYVLQVYDEFMEPLWTKKVVKVRASLRH